MTELREDGPAKLDGLDREIVRLLQEDGRRSYTWIAKRLGLSDGAVRNRVNRMMAEKVLRVVAVADPVKLGYTGYAMLLLKLAGGADPNELGEYFRDLPQVSYVLFAAGRYDLLVEVICESQDDLRAFLVEHCYTKPGVDSVEPMMSLKMYKNLLVWGMP
ncbi:MAG: Lrp/AsnC family transcriptional regulator [Rhodospirillaceae bacterium]|nr:Lrp/AsnC family transcriptional regulator [Rhodospirillaceae bacterium]